MTDNEEINVKITQNIVNVLYTAVCTIYKLDWTTQVTEDRTENESSRNMEKK